MDSSAAILQAVVDTPTHQLSLADQSRLLGVAHNTEAEFPICVACRNDVSNVLALANKAQDHRQGLDRGDGIQRPEVKKSVS